VRLTIAFAAHQIEHEAFVHGLAFALRTLFVIILSRHAGQVTQSSNSYG